MTRRRIGAAVSILVVALGVTLLVETALVGGGVGYLFGAALVLAGLARLYLSLK